MVSLGSSGEINAPERLAVLASYAVLDTPVEPEFDEIALRASNYCEAPVAAISFIARDRQWIKASVGLDVHETTLEHSVCRFTIKELETLVIPDLAADWRTKDSPFVTGERPVRFYAGAVLRSPEGQPLGAVCVADEEPRSHGLTPAQTDALKGLSGQVMSLLNDRRSIARQLSQLKSLLSRDAELAVELFEHGGLSTGGQMTAQELSDQMVFLGLMTPELAQLTGTNERWIRRLLKGAEPIPHWLNVLTVYWGYYGDALKIAREFARDVRDRD